MSTSNPRPANEGTPKPRRSMIEKLIVWGGILLLLLIVLVEWRSRGGYDATLSGVEERLTKGKIPLSELPSHIHGFALRGQDKSAKQRTITLKWPSLFKLYKVRLVVVDGDQIAQIDTVVSNDDDKPSKRDFVPKNGLPENMKDHVALETLDPSGLKGSLLRELLRQGFLITAEDDFGLPILDASIGDSIPMSESAAGFPFAVDMVIRREDKFPFRNPNNPFPDFKHTVQLIVLHQNMDGSQFRWQHEQMLDMGATDRFEPIADYAMRVAKGPFAEALTKAGCVKRPPPADSPSAPASLLDDRFDLASQFSRMRETHARLRRKPSAELLGQMVRASANLGSLTEHHWNCLNKVYKARALIYAGRLTAMNGPTPFALAHQAYAFALAGQHMTALKRVDAARKAKGTPAPEWLDLIEAYCLYQPETLEKVDGASKELATYLRMQMTDPVFDQQRTLRAIKNFQDLNPGSLKIAATYFEIPGLRVQRLMSEMGNEAIWAGAYRQILTIPNLPDEMRQTVESAAEAVQKSMTTRQASTEEFSLRRQLIEQLRRASDSSGEYGTSSWNTFAGMLSDESFVQAWRILDVKANMLAVSADTALQEVQPLVKGHRLASFLDSFQSDRDKATLSLKKFFSELPLSSREPVVQPAARRAVQFWGLTSGEVIGIARSFQDHMDDTFDDISRFQNWNHSSGTTAYLFNASEHWPQSVVGVIRLHWDEVSKDAKQYEEQFENEPTVLNELAKKYRELGRNADARRCAQKSIAASPSYFAYTLLAELYHEDDDDEQWRGSLEKALELPSLGLEDSQVHVQLAEYYLSIGEPQKARPHGQIAAASFSANGLASGAQCAEAMEDWGQAEQYMRALSQRYDSSTVDWYLWCMRTQHGNVDAARQFLDRYRKNLKPPYSREQLWVRAACHIFDNEISKAIEVFRESYAESKNPADAVFAAIYADRTGDSNLRDELLTEVEDHWNGDRPFESLADLMHAVLHANDPARWRRNVFDASVMDAAYVQIPFLYFVAGMFLEDHGNKDLAKEYLQCAATSAGFQNLARVLAAHELRSKGIEVDPPRKNVVPDSIADLTRLLDKSSDAVSRNEVDKAISYLDQGLKTQPEFLPALMARAKLFERQMNYKSAVADYESVLRLDPDLYFAHNNLGWVLAGCAQDDVRNGEQAKLHAELAAKLRSFTVRTTFSLMAAAEAECGQFDRAVELERKAQQMPGDDGWAARKMSSYLARKPYRRDQAQMNKPKGPNILPIK